MHHAYILPRRMEGEESRDFILKFLKLQKEDVEFRFFEEGNFKIERAREVKDALQSRAPEGVTRIICLSFVTMNDAAQNTLLKVVEEPGENTVFFFITSEISKLLPTIRSRVEMIDLERKDRSESLQKKRSLKELLDEAALIVEKIKDEKADKNLAVEFIDSLIDNARLNKRPTETMKYLLTLRSYIFDQSSSLKQILESAILLSYGI